MDGQPAKPQILVADIVMKVRRNRVNLLLQFRTGHDVLLASASIWHLRSKSLDRVCEAIFLFLQGSQRTQHRTTLFPQPRLCVTEAWYLADKASPKAPDRGYSILGGAIMH